MQEGILELLQLLLGWLVLGGMLLWMYWLGVEFGRAAARREDESDDEPEIWQVAGGSCDQNDSQRLR